MGNSNSWKFKGKFELWKFEKLSAQLIVHLKNFLLLLYKDLYILNLLEIPFKIHMDKLIQQKTTLHLLKFCLVINSETSTEYVRIKWESEFYIACGFLKHSIYYKRTINDQIFVITQMNYLGIQLDMKLRLFIMS